MTDPGIDAILSLLRQIDAVRRSGKLPPEVKYTPEEFLLKYGQAFIITPDTYAGERLPEQACYANCVASMIGHPELIYCEGYALGIIPVNHAWLVNPQGEVIDPTWDTGTAYFGIPMQRRYVLQRLQQQRVYGILDGMYNWELYEGRIDPHAFLQSIALTK